MAIRKSDLSAVAARGTSALSKRTSTEECFQESSTINLFLPARPEKGYKYGHRAILLFIGTALLMLTHIVWSIQQRVTIPVGRVV